MLSPPLGGRLVAFCWQDEFYNAANGIFAFERVLHHFLFICVCVCVKQRGRGDRRRQEEVCSVFREPCFQTVTSDGGGGDEQMYFVHASDRCTRKLFSSLHFADKRAGAPLQISSEPCSSLLPPPSLSREPALRRPQVGPSPATPATCPGSY